MCAIASNFLLRDQSLIVSERPAFFRSPALDASQRLRRIEVRPKYLRPALSVHARRGFVVKRRIGLGVPSANSAGSRPYYILSRAVEANLLECLPPSGWGATVKTLPDCARLRTPTRNR